MQIFNLPATSGQPRRLAALLRPPSGGRAEPGAALAAPLDARQLAACTGATRDRATAWLAPINAALAEFGIATLAQRAMFLAQAGHESGGLAWTRELWGPTPAQHGYEGRADLGNSQPGDGRAFCGRGLFQITGRGNYLACGRALGLDLVAKPFLLEGFEGAARSAGWYWQSRQLNALAGDVTACTRRLNGGENGLAQRRALWVAAQAALGVAGAA